MDSTNKELVAHRRKLCDQLFACTEERLALLTSSESWDTVAEHYLQLSAKWDGLRDEFDQLTHPASSPQRDKVLEQAFQKIAMGLEKTQLALNDLVGTAGSDLRTVKDQKMLMDAYYGMNQRGKHSIYFDEKK